MTAIPAKPRQTRYSTRIAKHKTVTKHEDDDDDDLLVDDDGIGRKPSHSHASMESYDVFQDRSKLSRGTRPSALGKLVVLQLELIWIPC